MASVEWSPTARRDLREIVTYISRFGHGSQIADKLAAAIDEKAWSYGRQPEMGSLHEELPDGFRSFMHTRYVGVYEVIEDGVTVHRVIDSARDFIRVFRQT